MHHTGVQQPHTFRWSRPHRRALPYLLLLLAASAVHAQHWPWLLFLHGAGERGQDLQRVSAMAWPTSSRSSPSSLLSWSRRNAP